ncbi:MAG: hypothetical protein FWH10_00595 [Oscillospiraceae bacterium]|nr:hypothetical protein [Oscillospiraceae bacterium]
MQRTLSGTTLYFKTLMPEDIPGIYPLKPALKSIGDDESIRSGVLAFRDFLRVFYDRLIADGGLYDKPPKQPESGGHPGPPNYPFLTNAKSVLVNIGYHGELAGNGASLSLGGWQPLTSIISSEGRYLKAKISVPKLIEALRFLTYCGVCFEGIDLDAGKPGMSNVTSLNVSYPDNPAMLTGLKVMSVAQKDFHVRGNDYAFLRCDYRALGDGDIDADSLFDDFGRLLSVKTRAFASGLRRRYLDRGLTCRAEMRGMCLRFIFSLKNKELWTFSASPDGGCLIYIKAQNTRLYDGEIESFPPPLRELIAKGYGCERKRFGEPCQKGCHGFKVPLDDSAPDISRYIEIWLDKELECLQRRSRTKAAE